MGAVASLVGVAIGSLGASRGFRFLLLVAALLFLAAGVFPLGDTSEIHIAAIATAFVLSVLAMYLFPSSAGRASLVLWLVILGCRLRRQ